MYALKWSGRNVLLFRRQVGIASVGQINTDEMLSSSQRELGRSRVLRHLGAECITNREGETVVLGFFWFLELICCFGKECSFHAALRPSSKRRGRKKR